MRIVDLYVMTPDGKSRVKADLGSDPDHYLARVDWAKDGRSLYVQRLSRDQKRLDMLRVDPATGRSSLLFSETSPTWVNLTDNFKPLKDGSLIWSSERSGYLAPLSLEGRQMDAAHAGRVGGRGRRRGR